jgi:UDP-glucose 4-epimerase
MKIVVTGGSGFIGTNLLEYLRGQYPDAELVSVDIREPNHIISGVNYKKVDVRGSSDIASAVEGASKIFHLAALIGTHESFDNPQELVETNLIGTTNLLEYVRQNSDTALFVAGMPGVWNNPYSISKDAALRMVKAYHEAYGVKACALRWFSVYGPKQYIARYNKAVPTFINQALHNQPFSIYGKGDQKADYLYAADAVELADKMLESRAWGKIIECGTGVGTSVVELTALIAELTGSSSQPEHLPMRLGEPEHAVIVADTSELLSLFPDFQLTGLSDGLGKTIDYYKQKQSVGELQQVG